MTLNDCAGASGVIKSIDGDDATRMRLVDMGLVGAGFKIRAKKYGAMLIDFYGESWRFSAVVDQRVARRIGITETGTENEACTLRKSERRQNDGF